MYGDTEGRGRFDPERSLAAGHGDTDYYDNEDELAFMGTAQ